MDEQQKETTEAKSSISTQGFNGGTEASEKSILQKAEEARKLLEAENMRMEANIASMKELEARRLLSGTAGGHIQTMTPQEKQLKKVDDMTNSIVSAFR